MWRDAWTCPERFQICRLEESLILFVFGLKRFQRLDDVGQLNRVRTSVVLRWGKVRRAYFNHGLIHTDNILETSDLPLKSLSDTMQIGHEFQEVVLHFVLAYQSQCGGLGLTCRVRLAFESLKNISTRLCRFSTNSG